MAVAERRRDMYLVTIQGVRGEFTFKIGKKRWEALKVECDKDAEVISYKVWDIDKRRYVEGVR